MSLGSFLFMAASWAVILTLFLYSLIRTLCERDEDVSLRKAPDETPKP